MRVLAIDPGTRESGFVLWDGKTILDKGMRDNGALLEDIRAKVFIPYELFYAIEGFTYYGKPVGRDVFDTLIFVGRVIEAAYCPVEIVYRRDIKLFLTGTVKSKDKDVRAALLARFGKEVTHGLAGHLWSAFSVAVYFMESYSDKINLEKKRIN